MLFQVALTGNSIDRCVAAGRSHDQRHELRSIGTAAASHKRAARKDSRRSFGLFCHLSQTAEKLQLGADLSSNGTRELLEQKETRSSHHWLVFHAPHSPGTLFIIPAKLLLPCLWETDLESNSLSLTTAAVTHHKSLLLPENVARRRTFSYVSLLVPIRAFKAGRTKTRLDKSVRALTTWRSMVS